MELSDPTPMSILSTNDFTVMIGRLRKLNTGSSPSERLESSLLLSRASSVYSITARVAEILADYHIWIRDQAKDRWRDTVKQKTRKERNVKHLMNVNIHGAFVQTCLAWLLPNCQLPPYRLLTNDSVPRGLVIVVITFAIAGELSMGWLPTQS